MKAIIDSIGDGTFTDSTRDGTTLGFSQQDRLQQFCINYFWFSYNSLKSLYRIGYWILVPLVVILVSRAMLRLDRPRWVK